MNLYVNGHLNAELLKKEKWLYFLCITRNNATNIERVNAISEITGKETLEYVLRTLEILDEMYLGIYNYEYEIIKKVLQWSEVAKGGTDPQRRVWESKSYPLDIHNLASAEIYLENSKDNKKDTRLIYTLIKTHGIIGQNIRGEVSVSKNNEIRELLEVIDEKTLETILYVLNKCIISAVDEKIWKNVEDEAEKIIDHIVYGHPYVITSESRLKSLYPNLVTADDEVLSFFENEIFPYFELWHFPPAFENFTIKEVETILNGVLQHSDANKATHLNFKPLVDTLYYDYEGKKHINIYKKRIIEKFLADNNNDHVSLDVTFLNNTLYVDFSFSNACEKLIDFCVEAERSGILSYEKSITMLFDMFGFRKDEFDRLNNEHKYLETMNQTETSTKNSIIDYVIGDVVVDVGSGGGVLLDLLEETYPDKEIIGTDISSNVIDLLDKKRRNEYRNWNVIKHNFVEDELKMTEERYVEDERLPFEIKANTILFSSILHEIFSYTETPNGCFEISSVEKALRNAYNSLETGGRIIIRDGVKTNSDETMTIRFKSEDGFDFFQNFTNDFKGLKELSKLEKVTKIEKQNGEFFVTGNINFIREFLYTYTWGNESYAHEVNEQFGYLTLDEYVHFFEVLGAKVLVAKEFLEEGYKTHLSPLVEIMDGKEFPNSNCIIVVEKQ